MRLSVLMFSTILLIPSFAKADVALFEDFEDGDVFYTTSDGEFSDGNEDYFTRTDGTNINSNVEFTNIQGDGFFAAQDIDDGNRRPAQQTVNFDNIDITDFENLTFSAFFAEDDEGINEDWDFNDFLLVEYRINDGAFNNLFAIESADTSNAGFNFAPAVDTNFDGVGNGAAITDMFTQYAAPIVGTGTDLDIRITIQLNAGDEDVAFDNILVEGDFTGIPEPSSFAIVAMVGVGILNHRRK